MQFKHISKALSLQLEQKSAYHEFSILIPLIDIDNQIHVLFEVRSANLKSQPNEICFPGGRIEGDESPLQGAIRETTEEILVKPEQIEILGSMMPLTTPFMYRLNPFVAKLNHYDPMTHPFNSAEVETLFTVPLEFFLTNEPEVHVLQSNLMPSDQFPYHKIQNGQEYNFKTTTHEVLFYEYGDRIIWGLTAKMLHEFIRIIL